MIINKVKNIFNDDFSQISNVMNTSRIIIKSVLDDDVPERLWEDGEKALMYLNNKHYHSRYELCPYHFIIDSLGNIYQNRHPEVDSLDLLPGFKDDIQIFLLCRSLDEVVSRDYSDNFSVSPIASLTNLIAMLSDEYNIALMDPDKNITFIINENDSFLSEISNRILNYITKVAIMQRNARNQLYAACENILYNEPDQTIQIDRIPQGRYGFNVLYPIEQSRLLLKITDQNGASSVLRPGLDYNEIAIKNDRNSNEVYFLHEIKKTGHLDVIILNNTERVYKNVLIRPLKVIPNLDVIERIRIGLQIDSDLFSLLNGHINFRPEGTRLSAKYKETLWPSSIVGVRMEDDEIESKLGIYEKDPLDFLNNEKKLLNTPDRLSKRISSILIFIPSDVRYNLNSYMKYILARSKNIQYDVQKTIE